MEARAAGLPIVTSELAALRETVGPHGVTLAWDGEEDDPRNQTAEYQRAFVDATVALLSDEERWAKWQQRARRGVADLDWSRRIPLWEQLLPNRKPAKRRSRAKAAA
jgi:glycosyltransferase involved in cell wall biosynthesis